MKKVPRGIRNCNPGNIRHGENWEGLHPYSKELDESFCVFVSPKYGIRALCKILMNYNKLYCISTVAGIINRYAPPVENETDAYITHIANKLGVNPIEPINILQPEVMYLLISAIILHENGKNPYSEEEIRGGMLLAGL